MRRKKRRGERRVRERISFNGNKKRARCRHELSVRIEVKGEEPQGIDTASLVPLHRRYVAQRMIIAAAAEMGVPT